MDWVYYSISIYSSTVNNTNLCQFYLFRGGRQEETHVWTLSWPFSPKLSQLTPLSWLTPVISPFPIESAVILADCDRRGWYLECSVDRHPAQLSFSRGEKAWFVLWWKGLYLVGVAQLWFFGNSSYWYVVSVHNILPPAGFTTLVDSCCLSVSTIAG